MTLLALMFAGCTGSEPTMVPVPDPEPEPPPHRSIDELPGPRPMPVPDDTEVVWVPIDPATVEPIRVDACNPGLAPLFSANTVHDANLAGQVRRAALGCTAAGRHDDARRLAEALLGPHAEPVDHFVVARTWLAQRAEDGDPCEHETYSSGILEQVAAAADPVVSARMIGDPLFESVRTAYRYHLAIQPGRDKLAERLVGTVWFGPGNGAFGSTHELHLRDNGVAVERRATFDDVALVWTETEGTWAVEDGKLTVRVGETEDTYDVAEDGSLSRGGGPAMFDVPSECEA